jgi:dihydroorotate dehydrogenase
LNSYRLLRPALFHFDAEVTHNFVHSLSRIAPRIPFFTSYLEQTLNVRASELHTKVFGIDFANPVGLAAGFDKNGQLVDFMESIGFGFCEIGSVTHRRSPGNPKPRLFRLPEDEALINRMGLNNGGPDVVLANLKQQRLGIPIGINIAKTNSPRICGKDAVNDIATCYAEMQHLADFLVLNVSCPNTEDGRTFEEPESLDELLAAVLERRADHGSEVPVLLKFSADLSLDQLSLAVETALKHDVAGFVLTNTSADRKGLKTDGGKLNAIGRGGLSGRPLREGTRLRVQHVRKQLQAARAEKAIVGVGGVDSAQSAYELICAGASLVELYTGLVYQGPRLIQKINRGLLSMLRSDGFINIMQAVGVRA